MFRNYLKIAIRNIARHKSFSFINILGLAISMSTCLLVILILADLKSYDQFHTKKDRIYRLLSKPQGSEANATTPYPLGDALVEEYHGIESMVRIRSWVGGDVRYGDNVAPLSAYYASKDFLKVFDFGLAEGNKYKALEEPNSIVLSHELAEQLFKDEDPLGKQVSFIDKGMGFLGMDLGAKENDLGNFIVTGVLDKNPYKSHFEFEALFSFSTLESLAKQGKETIEWESWRSYWSYYHYIMLKEDVSTNDLESVLTSISETQYAPFDKFNLNFILEPLPEITPGKMHSNPISLRLPIEAFYFLAILAILVIFSACFNYTNLSIAKALSRAREVGLRKISGAYRKQIFFQFISEAVVISFIALILAVGLLQIIKIGFAGLWLSKYIQIQLDENLYIGLAFILFSMATGIVAGLIPATYLSSFKPVSVLKADFGSTKTNKGGFLGKAGLSKSLIVAQFTISLLFIITATLVYFQLNYVMKKEYGFDKENIINIKILPRQYDIVKTEMSSYPEIKKISACSFIPATGFEYGSQIKDSMNPDDSLYVSFMSVDQNLLENLGLKIIAGDIFPDKTSTSEQYIMVSELTVKELGFENPNEILGRNYYCKNADKDLQVIGVFSNFHHKMFLDEMGPMAFRNNPDDFKWANIKITGNDIPGTLSFLEGKWKEIDEVHSFEYRFMDEQLANTHGLIRDILTIVGYIAFLAISIACMGLLGMAIFSTESRIKEIGVRKVMGGSTQHLVFLLSRKFIILLGIAAIIGSPIAYFINNIWLQEFAYRVNFGVGIFAIGIGILLILSLITVGSQTYRTANSNPADTLRTE